MNAHYEIFDPLFSARQAEDMVKLCEDFGSYGMYSEEGLNEGIGEGLPQRVDAIRNFLRTGGRKGQVEPIPRLAARTNYFRETYGYGDDISAPGIEPFLHHEGFIECARRIHGRPIIEPAIAYANLFVPGQQLATHTDVPEFRGANRKLLPEWLLVVMHHSRLFEEWRMPIATAIAYFHECDGGELAFYPDGPDRPATVHKVRFNTAVMLDTDSVFHGVDRLAEKDVEIPDLKPGMKLNALGDRVWNVTDAGRELARYPWEDLRLSVSWKGYAFRDEAERDAWRDHAEDLSSDFILDRITTDLRERGVIDAPPERRELALLMIDEYVRFPGAPAD